MSAAETPDEDPRTDTDNDDTEEDEPRWIVEEDGMALLRRDYSDYELHFGGFELVFRDIRDSEDEDGYTLKGRRHELGTFDPTDEGVPEEISIAFMVLAHEI